ncbi:unnamed protein product [Ranitomeya imitator]|uniref:Helix-turn-helix domain-containing protein n=1 Tax=Ranitomeya imitator TaxID=111125 RepID=A0ABN9LTT2_9NEOB|nr:unnamed protein product [Ranitomeya imitator]
MGGPRDQSQAATSPQGPGSADSKEGRFPVSTRARQRSATSESGRPVSLNPTHNELIVTLLEFVLTNNYFTFDGKILHQLRGTAMGTPCSPTYANLFLGWWEDNIAFSEQHTNYLAHIDLWVRYIDDIFVIWKGTKEEFGQFMMSLNNNHVGLKFTFDIQEFQLPFLDVLITKSRDGDHLESTIYRKPTATNSLLRWDSSHLYSLKKGIPKGQYLRLRRNCSNQRDFKVMADDLRLRFLARGYPDRILREAFRYANKQEG